MGREDVKSLPVLLFGGVGFAVGETSGQGLRGDEAVCEHQRANIAVMSRPTALLSAALTLLRSEYWEKLGSKSGSFASRRWWAKISSSVSTPDQVLNTILRSLSIL
jgi:hypothetical protein